VLAVVGRGDGGEPGHGVSKRPGVMRPYALSTPINIATAEARGSSGPVDSSAHTTTPRAESRHAELELSDPPSQNASTQNGSLSAW
jgi:hypothetical protein